MGRRRGRIQRRGYERDVPKLRDWEQFRCAEPINFPISHDYVLDVVSGMSPDALVGPIVLQFLGGTRTEVPK